MVIKKMSLIVVFAAASGMQPAQAHTAFVISAQDAPVANTNYMATLSVGHGCSEVLTDGATIHHDTEKLIVEVPSEIITIRPLDAPWGAVEVVTNDSGQITQLIWTRTHAVHAEDRHLYQASFRLKLPNTPFTAVNFPVHQVCTDSNAAEITTSWIGVDVPKINIQPAHMAGWNKYTAQADIDFVTIQTFFKDALIVWSGSAAYSSNPVTDGLISNKLTTIPAAAEYWVKY